MAVDARKVRIGRAALAPVLAGVSTLVVAKGKNCVEHDLGANGAGQTDLAELLLGPSGNLRAPTARVGKVLLVGFGELAWASALG